MERLYEISARQYCQGVESINSRAEKDDEMRKQWNVDDWARLIHLWADPRCATLVTKTVEPLNRVELDF